MLVRRQVWCSSLVRDTAVALVPIFILAACGPEPSTEGPKGTPIVTPSETSAPTPTGERPLAHREVPHKVFEPVGRFLGWIGSFFPSAPYARILLWTVIALGAAALLWALFNRLWYGEWRWRLPRLARATDVSAEEALLQI